MAASEQLPGAVTRAGWSCPGCETNYNPDVASCSCTATKPPPAGLAGRLEPQVISIPGGIAAPACTCPQGWNGICPPPPCPAHGQAAMIRITC